MARSLRGGRSIGAQECLERRQQEYSQVVYGHGHAFMICIKNILVSIAKSELICYWRELIRSSICGEPRV